MKWALLTLLVSFNAFAKGKASLCHPMEIGHYRRADLSDGMSKSKVEQRHVVRRDSEYEYSAFINFNFKLKGELAKTPEFKNEFRAKVESCFREREDKLVDEMGRKLKLHLYDPQLHKEVPSPVAVNIDIQNINDRSNSGSYFHKATCATIVHETLHLMGLADEYEEKWKGKNVNPITSIFKPWTNDTSHGHAYDCRAIGPDTSIMNNHYVMDTTKKTIFFSGHLDVILYPNCSERNDDYYECSKLAYKSNKKNTPNGCGEVREICRTNQWVLSKESPDRTEIESIAITQTQHREELNEFRSISGVSSASKQ